MLRPRSAMLTALIFITAGLAAAAPAAEPASGQAGTPIIIVYDAHRGLALVPDGTLVPKGLQISVQLASRGNEGEALLGPQQRQNRAPHPLVFGMGAEADFRQARKDALALGLIATEDSAVRPPITAASTESCTDVLLYLAPNIFHRATGCAGGGSYDLYSYATTRIGTDLLNTNIDPYHTISWHCERPNTLCTLFTDTAGYGGGAWTRSEAWIESIYPGHGPDFGETIIYYSSISF